MTDYAIRPFRGPQDAEPLRVWLPDAQSTQRYAVCHRLKSVTNRGGPAAMFRPKIWRARPYHRAATVWAVERPLSRKLGGYCLCMSSMLTLSIRTSPCSSSCPLTLTRRPAKGARASPRGRRSRSVSR